MVLVGLRVDVLTKTSHYNLDRENKERERRGEEKRERSTTTATRSPAKESQTLSGDWVNLSSLIGSGLLAGLRVAALTKTYYYNLDSENKKREREKRREEKRRERDQPLRQHEARPKKVRHYLVTG